MLLFKIGLSRLLSKPSLISRTNLLPPFVKMVNSSKEGMLFQFKRWSRIALSFAGLVFLNVKGDILICSPDLTFKCLSVSPQESAKSRGLRGSVGYVGPWVAWVKILRGLRGLRESKYFYVGQHFT